jgi:hypothetical protein
MRMDVMCRYSDGDGGFFLVERDEERDGNRRIEVVQAGESRQSDAKPDTFSTTRLCVDYTRFTVTLVSFA